MSRFSIAVSFGLLALVFSSASTPAQEDKIDLTAISDLPVRFNGRVSTLEQVANNYAQMIGDATEFQNAEGITYSAFEVYLHLLTARDGDVDIQLFPLSDRMAKDSGIARNESGRYSIDELLSAQEKISELISVAQAKTDDELTAADQLALNLGRRFEIITQLRNGHYSPWELNTDAIIAIAEQRQEIDGTAIPRMVPPQKAGEQWHVLFPAAFDEFASTEFDVDGFARHPIAKPLCELLTAYKNGDGEAFASISEKVTAMYEEYAVDQEAFVFAAPKNWIEEGTVSPYELKVYSDAMSTGVPVCMLNADNDSDSATIIVNHFPQTEVPLHTLVNSWRINIGLAPLSDDQIDEALADSMVGGMPGKSLEVTTDPQLPIRAETTLVNVLHHESGTWVVSLYGPPKKVRESVDDYQRFVESIRIGAGIKDHLAVGAVPEIEVDYELAMLNGIIKGREFDWVISVVASGSVLEENRETLLDFIRSIREERESPGTEVDKAFRAEIPSDWQTMPVSGTGIDYYMPTESEYISIRVFPLPRLSDDATVALAQHWRKQLHFDPLSRDEIESKIKVDLAGELELLLIESYGLPPSPNTDDD